MILFEHTDRAMSLLPDGAVFLHDTATIVLADVHLGKAAAFRAGGLPVPEGDTSRDLGRIAAIARDSRAREVIVAGDLFHAPSGITPELADELAAFLESLGIPLFLVGGNHDRKIRSLPCGLESMDELDRGGIRIIHDPADHRDTGQIHLAGHWHPIARIRDGKRTCLRLPAFLLRGQVLVLPSFGSFTGGAPVDAGKHDRIFVPIRDQVVEVPSDLVV